MLLSPGFETVTFSPSDPEITQQIWHNYWSLGERQVPEEVCVDPAWSPPPLPPLHCCRWSPPAQPRRSLQRDAAEFVFSLIVQTDTTDWETTISSKLWFQVPYLCLLPEEKLPPLPPPPGSSGPCWPQPSGGNALRSRLLTRHTQTHTVSHRIMDL